ncbi:hypothetical protein [Actinoplanes derwentensis]|uniref:PilZ domain-containing protein n=1 Tax=Actinoplanes derwentensis TaxID=113562 RepID=A0A1H2CJE7_9ACTN|nr:hypothetical protein [Actinoplanes derwentensis]GID82606.1 hypothetical protein Ade03nite_15300 [Actinoplanes derwentensis]SDT70603.1 hypothetical protein SAMN04489716_5986 [Actinoplanes derwentensis]
MTSSLFPSDGSRVEMVHGALTVPDVRVVRVTDTAVTLSLALDDVDLSTGDGVHLRWPAGLRGRYALHGTVAGVDENRIDVRVAGQPEIEQLRDYVRGGGGESVLLVLPGETERYGRVHDISERSVRALFHGIGFEPGQETRLRVQLAGDVVVEFPATVLRAATIRQQVPVRGPLLTEIVAIFEQDERQAKIIRRYVMRLQLEARRQSRAVESPDPEPMAEIIALR